MPNSFRVTKTRIIYWVLGLVGIFLILSGEPSAFPFQLALLAHLLQWVHRRLFSVSVSFSVLSAFANQKASLGQTQMGFMGFCGQALLGIVAFAIPLAPSVAYPLIPPFTSSPFNLQHLFNSPWHFRHHPFHW